MSHRIFEPTCSGSSPNAVVRDGVVIAQIATSLESVRLLESRRFGELISEDLMQPYGPRRNNSKHPTANHPSLTRCPKYDVRRRSRF